MKDFSNKYLAFLKKDLAGLNLTNILDEDDFYNKQIIDSILPSEKCTYFKNSLEEIGFYMDIGFGGGFPLVPLAYKFSQVEMIGIELRRKKADAVKKIVEHLDIKNVRLYHGDIDHLLIDRDACIGLKAVGKIQDYLKKIHSDKNVRVFFYKGPNFEELEPEYMNPPTGWNFVEKCEIEVPGTQKRYLLSYVSKNVPRGTFKNLVRLSSYQLQMDQENKGVTHGKNNRHR